MKKDQEKFCSNPSALIFALPKRITRDTGRKKRSVLGKKKGFGPVIKREFSSVGSEHSDLNVGRVGGKESNQAIIKKGV